jgi:hypothetical protein
VEDKLEVAVAFQEANDVVTIVCDGSSPLASRR